MNISKQLMITAQCILKSTGMVFWKTSFSGHTISSTCAYNTSITVAKIQDTVEWYTPNRYPRSCPDNPKWSLIRVTIACWNADNVLWLCCMRKGWMKCMNNNHYWPLLLWPTETCLTAVLYQVATTVLAKLNASTIHFHTTNLHFLGMVDKNALVKWWYTGNCKQ